MSAATPTATQAQRDSTHDKVRAFSDQDCFAERHIGPRERDIQEMLAFLGLRSLEELSQAAVPKALHLRVPLATGPAASERDALRELAAIAGTNQVWRSFLGLGYSDCVTPPVIQRNVLENPGWYTQYTPYQPEISQGRLEALLAFQTMVIGLTGLQIANASMLDEGTAAAEAMSLCLDVCKDHSRTRFFVAADCHPQTLEIVRTRAHALGLEVVSGDPALFDFRTPVFGALLQYPATDGGVRDPRAFIERAHAAGALVVMAADPLALLLLESPGKLGADIAIGSTQRFGVPLGFGGPHAAYFATREAFKRSMPGRLIGVSIDRHGKPAMRLALQTREQHIRREKATSNICTAQVLLAVIAACYAVYHGPEGLKRIAARVQRQTQVLAEALRGAGKRVREGQVFDTLRIDLAPGEQRRTLAALEARQFLVRQYEDGLGLSLDETTTELELCQVIECFRGSPCGLSELEQLEKSLRQGDYGALARTTPVLEHPVFTSYHSETEMMRWLKRLEARDLSLTTSMIPLGSCTMKLNAAAEMLPITWPGFGRLHPFAPASQTQGYQQLFRDLERWLCDITGFDACSLQPNAGSQGEYAGLLAIKSWQSERGAAQRSVCLIPHSAHGTNPASEVMAGFEVVVVDCDAQGNIDLPDLHKKVELHSAKLGALMVTYPSTHGVYEASIRDICALVHKHGGQVYMDGANLNAQVGILKPGELGADVCHINLHKTFCIPHGGGGPGMGPICVGKHLAAHLPGHPLAQLPGKAGSVSAAPWGSASILPISWMYIRMMGADGLKKATQVAVLNANYLAKKLGGDYPVLYTGVNGFVAHECIFDTRGFKSAGIEVDDIAKRLMDFGFHAPTMSFPVPGTLMVEPTESESKEELDRFVTALQTIRAEIRAVESGALDKKDNPLKNAPHTLEEVTASEWKHAYSREQAGFPAPWLRVHKFWPTVGRIDNAYGDKNLVCACPSVESYR
ncbi:MAG: aminomethyl-transferring glycine dehydrogenase [Planctomycetes bacterium]|nr:aminomethyl-transferring glycine dehydrogenase [Planctomycetota bacterium]